MTKKVTETVSYIGVDDISLDLFESQYVIPRGISYNSYVISDKKIAVLDTVDGRAGQEWEENLLTVLKGKKPDYLIIHHLEPDHAGSIVKFLELFPEAMLVGNEKTFRMLPQFLNVDVTGKTQVVKEGDTLSLGEHTLSFFMAPMVHWPEVMVSYDRKDKILFSADAFGKFGALDLKEKEDWVCEARRYYFNIVGKYGAPVQALLKKVGSLDIQHICPLHGPILKENIGYYLGLYDMWSRYQAESEGVLIAYASFHGNTAKVAEKLGELLREKGVSQVVIRDLAREDMAEVIEDAFRYDRMVVAASSYDGGVFPAMQDFLYRLQSKAYQKRKVAMIENSSWAPSAGKSMRGILDTMKELEIVEPVVTIRSAMKESDVDKLKELADVL